MMFKFSLFLSLSSSPVKLYTNLLSKVSMSSKERTLPDLAKKFVKSSEMKRTYPDDFIGGKIRNCKSYSM